MSKGERANRVKNNLWTEDDVRYWLSEVEYIEDDTLREQTIDAILTVCPDYFTERPSSSTGKYHSVDERGKYGNLIHTKRVFAEYCNLAESWVKMDLLSEREVDEGRAAALLHDMMKYGWQSDRNGHTVDDHDLVIGDAVMHMTELPESIVRLLVTHMGPWAEGPEPRTYPEILLHTADKSAARESNDIGVYDVPEEVLEEWPDLTIDDGEP